MVKNRKKERIEISEALFDKIKTELDRGVKPKKIEAYFGISQGSIWRIKKCETYKDYRLLLNYLADMWRQKHAGMPRKVYPKVQDILKKRKPRTTAKPIELEVRPQEVMIASIGIKIREWSKVAVWVGLALIVWSLIVH